MLSFTCSDKVCILLTELVTRIVQCLVERTFTTIISDLIDIYFRMFINNCRHLLFCQLEVNNCAQFLLFQLLERFHQPTNFITDDHSIVEDNISSARIAEKISPARIEGKTATIQSTACQMLPAPLQSWRQIASEGDLVPPKISWFQLSPVRFSGTSQLLHCGENIKRVILNKTFLEQDTIPDPLLEFFKTLLIFWSMAKEDFVMLICWE